MLNSKHAFEPAAIAVVGASEDTNKTGGRALDFLKRFGFPGRIFAVNPTTDSIQGLTTHARIQDLPVVPELVIIALPGALVTQTVRQCAEFGVKVVIVTSSGFGELGEHGRAVEEQMLSIGRAHGMRIIGPNSQGLANFASGAVASFSSLFLEVLPADGPVAIISQSGSMSVVPYCQLREKKIGVRYCVATGNQIDLDVGDFALAAIEDPAIKLVLLYFESLSHTSALREAACKARVRGIPIVALKSGSSVIGQSAARSHTGALATEDRVVDAFLSKHGVWRAQDADELVRASELYLKGWIAHGRRLVILTDSGASAVMMADSAARLGLDVVGFPESIRNRLAEILPAYASVSNPIDMTSVLRTNPELYGKVLDVVVDSEIGDLFVVAFPASGKGYDVAGLAKMTSDRFSQLGLPVTVAIPQPSIANWFRDVGIPTFASETEALKALHQLACHADLLNQVPVDDSPGPIMQIPGGNNPFMSEAESLAFLKEQGLPVVAHENCQTLSDAKDTFLSLGAPVVLKGSSPELQHKSELGLVLLYVTEAEQLLVGFQDLLSGMSAIPVKRDGVIVASMLRGRYEMMIGARFDPVFGPVVLIGEGGKYVETIGNVVALSPPFSSQHVRRALGGLSGSGVWEGVRGEPGADLDEFALLACRVGDLMLRVRGVASVDLNPVLVGKPGEGVLIADALIERVTDG